MEITLNSAIEPTPVTTQPRPGGPSGRRNCPPGLERLSQLDQLLVYQDLDHHTCPGLYQYQTRFTIFDGQGQSVYYSQEESNCCVRWCCGADRPFHMDVMDTFGNKVITMNRPFACMYCCCPCWLMTMEVMSPPGTPIGVIEQKWSFMAPKYEIKDTTGEVLLRIEGAANHSKCFTCDDVVFKVLSGDGTLEVGRIVSEWQGWGKSCGSQVDDFLMTFSVDLDVRMKALLLGACFMVNMMYFESQFKTKTRV